MSRIATPLKSPPQTPAPGTVTTNSPLSTTETPDAEISWEKVDEALAFLSKFDVLDLAATIVNRAAESGPKDVYNQAGSVRFKLSQARRVYGELQRSICRETLEEKRQKIEQLVAMNEAKSWMGNVLEDGDV